MNVAVHVASSVPDGATVLGVLVYADGAVPDRQEFDRATLAASGFSAGVGDTLVLPRIDGPTLIEVGLGRHADMDAAGLRDAAAAFARAAARHGSLVLDASGIGELEPAAIAHAVVEGVLLARYRYRGFVDQPAEAHLTDLTLVTGARSTRGARAGAERGLVTARAVATARDLCNTPATHLTARRYAEVAQVLGAETGLDVEVFDERQLAELGCGGLLGVNAGSAEPARMIKLTYTPDVKRPSGHLGLVGKGIMYDAGGISLKPSDAMHAAMKLDMSGSAAILGAMTTLRDLGCRTRVTGWLMCTDNMPSGTATRLGDVLTIHGGKTVEVVNADAEGRLVMADALVMAVEAEVDAIVTVATLTGAAMRTFGTAVQRCSPIAATWRPSSRLPATQPTSSSSSCRSSASTGRCSSPPSRTSRTWAARTPGPLPPACSSRSSPVASPFGHLDICGPMMTDRDDSWRSVGANAFGTRLLADFARNFRRPAA